MRQWITGTALSLMAMTAIADAPPLVLDKVSLQLSERDWVTTNKALLQTSVNMTMKGSDMVLARTEIMKNLGQIASGKWHITQFNRSQDSSGLERLHVAAEARVDQKALTNVYKQAKAVSKPGAFYKVEGIDFSPSLVERQQMKKSLRTRLYQKVQKELEGLNKIYPEQHYSVNRINFMDNDGGGPLKSYKTREMNAMAMPAAAVRVSNEMVLTAVVTLASNRVSLEGGDAN